MYLSLKSFRTAAELQDSCLQLRYLNIFLHYIQNMAELKPTLSAISFTLQLSLSGGAGPEFFWEILGNILAFGFNKQDARGGDISERAIHLHFARHVVFPRALSPIT